MAKESKYKGVIKQLLKLLVYGPVKKEVVLKELRPLSRRQLNRLIERLIKLEYLQVRQYVDPDNVTGNILVLVLKQAGADKVASLFGLERENVRTAAPQISHLEHELGLRELLKKISNEAVGKVAFELLSLKDDAALKRAYMHEKGKMEKGVYFGDFELKISAKDFPFDTLILEFDNGQKGRQYWSNKIGYIAKKATEQFRFEIIVLIATTHERVNLLYDYTIRLDLKGSNVYIFLTLEEFLRKGVTGLIDLIKQRNNLLAFYNCSTGKGKVYQS